MATIDDKVVAISFETKDFENGVKRVLDSMESLKKGLKLDDAGKGLDELSKHANRFSLSNISDNLQHIASRFSALGAIGFTVIQNLTNAAIKFGSQIAHKILDPIIQGGKQRALNIEQAKFQFKALGQNVELMMKSSLAAVKGTAYGLDEAAKAAGQFGAAGIDAGAQMTRTLRGVAGVAAVTNSSFSDISQIFTTIAGAGKINSQQLYQFATRGLNVAAALAKQWNTTEQNVRKLASEGKISFKQFAAAMDDAFGKHAKEANKTYTGALMNLKAAQSRIGADFWTPFLKAQRNVFNALSPMFDRLHEAIMPLIDLWGATVLKRASSFVKVINGMSFKGLTKAMPFIVKGIKNLLDTANAIGKVFRQAFRDIFPPATVKQFVDFAKAFKAFTRELKPSPTTLANLRRTFAGLFAILDIGKQVLGGILSIFGRVFSAISDGSGGFLAFTARIGDWLVKVDKALKKGKVLGDFFDHLGDILARPIIFIQELSRTITKLFSGKFNKAVQNTTQAMGPFGQILAAISESIGNFVDRLGGLQGVFKTFMQGFVSGLQQLGPAVANAISGMSFEPILQVIRTGLLGGIFLLFKNFLGPGSGIDQITKGFGGGILNNISESFDALSGSLQAMQTNIKANTILQIAIAVGILSAAMVALSFVDPKRLNSALAAITLAFAQLLGAMAILGNVTKTLGFVKMPVMAATLILLAGAIFTLSAAVAIFGHMSWSELIKGLGATAAILVGLVAITGPLSKASPRMIIAGVALQAIGVGLNILALAVRQFGSMNLMQLGKGLASIGLTLFIIATYIKMFPSGASMLAQGAGLILIGAALNILALAVRQLGSMDLLTLGKGLAAIGLSLAIIAGGMRLMGGGKGMMAQAAGLLIVSVALQGLVRAIGSLGGMSMTQLAKGLGSLAIALGLLGVALIFMEGTMGGAAALAVAAAGVATLSTALILLGKQPIKAIVTGLAALAVAFALIIAAGILMDAAAPGLLAFGVAVALVGAGLALAGAGIFLAAAGIGALVTAVIVAVGVIPKAITDLQAALVENAKNLVLGVLEIANALAETAPKFVDAIIKILDSVIDALIKIIPKLDELINVLITHILAIFHQQQGPIIQAGMELLLALLKGIRDHIGEVISTVVDIIIAIIKGIVGGYRRIITAGINIVVSLIKGIAQGYSRIISAALSIITRFLGALANNLGKIVTAGGRIIASVVNGIAKNVGKLIAAGANVIVAFINGIGRAGPRIITAATNTIIKLITALQKNANKLADAGFKVMIAFIRGLTNTINQQAPALRQAGFQLGVAIVNGMTGGLVSKGQELLGKITGLMEKAKAKMHLPWKSKSPSKVTYDLGQNIMLGLANGMKDNAKAVNAAENASQSVIDMFNTVFQTASPSKVMYAIGLDVVGGFAEGLKKGTEEDIRGAFGEMRQKLADEGASLRSAMSEETVKMGELRKKGKKRTADENAALRKLTQTYIQHDKALKAVAKSNKLLATGLDADRGKLIAKANEYAKLSEKIEKVKDIVKEFKDQYGELPSVVSEDEAGAPLTAAQQVAKYTESLTKQVAAVKQYNATLVQLRALGLDDATYRMLLEEGTSGQAFAEQLLAGGPPAIAAITALDSQLDSAAQTLGDNAALNLYKAGEEAAQGLVAGLEANLAAIQKVMNTIADGMVDRLKKKLKIKSPSEVFAELGQFSMEGMAKGFSDSTPALTEAVDQAAADAIAAMQNSMKDISDVVTEGLDPNPVITPILDLTEVQKKQAELAALTNVAPITAGVSTGQASAISAAQTAAEAEQVAAAGGTNFKFEQNNYSPEALSDVEIYRQTKNQLSQVKLALGVT